MKTDNISKAPVTFSVLLAVNVACYALCNVMMVKVIEGNEVSIFSILLMMICSLLGMRIGGKVREHYNSKGVGLFVGAVIVAFGITICLMDVFEVMNLQGPKVMSTLTGDSIFFTITYVLSDVFSEVFGYRASRISNTTAAVFTLATNFIAKGLTYIPGPDYAQANDDAFQFVYGGGFYVAIMSVLIYMIGDFLNDKVFAYLKDKKSADAGYRSYSLRTILSSMAGKSVDIAMFSLLVFVPFSNDSFCKIFGIESWGMTTPALLGNFLLGIALQTTTEIALTPASYAISYKLRQSMYKHEPIKLNS